MDFRIIETKRFEVVGRVSTKEIAKIIETMDPDLQNKPMSIGAFYNAATGKTEVAYEKRFWLTVEEESTPQCPYPKGTWLKKRDGVHGAFKFDPETHDAVVARPGDYQPQHTVVHGVQFEPVDLEDGDLIPLEEWIEGVKCKAFTDYDGLGEFATAHYHSDQRINPSEYKTIKFPEWCTHIFWYNK